MPSSHSHESEEERQARLSDPEIDDEEEEEDNQDNDENYDYLQATRRLDAEELQAEEEGERLIDDNADDGFVFGMKDAEKEAAAFYAAGFDPEGEDLDLLDNSSINYNEEKEIKAKRAADKHLYLRDKINKYKHNKDIWQQILG
ncbi:hypothetical protein, conserved [Eimeria maxima]|uniref:Uncharacterized protein n=1 Tax=Eimeria maxima TaxID=5804 RepID=U6MIL9_EIMMA|nr:hypothetical protein, conserved [Eimeria maxima]CDJ61500.1 hypothetical protein, conserved [Eimeria maxima]